MISNPEQSRLAENQAGKTHWQRWGPYLSERSWGTVREDYSADGDAWNSFPHDHARSRALLRVGGGLHLHLKQRFEGAIDPGKSQVYQMVEALLTPPHSTPLEALLDQPFASAFNHPPPQR